MGERSGDNIVICMLDWKQAFDRISHPPDDAGLGKVELTKKIQKSYCKLLHGPFPPSETRQFSVACQISRCRHTSGMPTLPISAFTRHDCSVSRHALTNTPTSRATRSDRQGAAPHLTTERRRNPREFTARSKAWSKNIRRQLSMVATQTTTLMIPRGATAPPKYLLQHSRAIRWDSGIA